MVLAVNILSELCYNGCKEVIMVKITIISNITVKPGKLKFVKAKLQKLVKGTRSKEGCLQYDLHQDNENTSHFLIFEIWKSSALWQAHMDSQYMEDYMSETEGAVEEFTINEMTHIA